MATLGICRDPGKYFYGALIYLNNLTKNVLLNSWAYVRYDNLSVKI